MVKQATILIAESGSGYGGTAKYLADLVALLGRRFALRVAAVEDGPFIERVRSLGVPVDLVPDWRHATGMRHEQRGGRVRGYARYLKNAVLPLAARVFRIRRWLLEHRIRVVHLNNELLSHLPLILAARLAGCRVICHLHGWRPLIRTERWAAQFVDRFVSVTYAGAAYYQDQLGGRPVLAIPNGLILNGQTKHTSESRSLMRRSLGIDDQHALVVAIGRMIPLKGYPVFLQALAQLIRRGVAVDGLIVGNDPSPGGAYTEELKRLAHDLGIDRSVRFLPWQANVASLYAAADIVVQSSIEAESFGYVALEAMASGKPVVASRIGGLVDLVADGATGFLVTPADPQALAAALGRLLGDRRSLEAFGANARTHARTFTMERNVEAVGKLYEELLAC